MIQGTLYTLGITAPSSAPTFSSFQEWVNKGRSWLARDPLPSGRMSKKPNPVVCEDAKGRTCRNGGDFRRAQEEGAFPVRFGWPIVA